MRPGPANQRQRQAALGVLPSVLAAGLSKFTCSLCLAAYTGVLSSLGVSGLATNTGLLVLTLALLAAATAGVGWTTRRHRHPGPLALTVLGVLVVAGGRIAAASAAWLYSGSALLVAGSLWNMWLVRRRGSVPVQVRPEAPTER